MELLLPIALLVKTTQWKWFTFQYGATATMNPVLLTEEASAFTFQYGATATLKR